MNSQGFDEIVDVEKLMNEINKEKLNLLNHFTVNEIFDESFQSKNETILSMYNMFKKFGLVTDVNEIEKFLALNEIVSIAGPKNRIIFKINKYAIQEKTGVIELQLAMIKKCFRFAGII